jgi:flavin-dependent dehydrogenase
MAARHLAADIAVVGGGPAGAAAAIACAQQGLRVLLLEREPPGHARPGDTLHPGIAPLLRQLGAEHALADASGARHAGVWSEWGGPRRFTPFGSDADGPWLGYQVERALFDECLLARAQALGVTLLRDRSALAPLLQDGAVCGLETDAGPITARIVFDASGRSRWLGRAIGIDSPAASPPLVARYGYVEGSRPELDAAPLLCGAPQGWCWATMVRPGLYQWTWVALDGSKRPPDWLPPPVQGLTPFGRARGADVTWRLSSRPAGPGWFMVGDAAALLDPSSSHGVLKGLMSGIAAARLAAAVLHHNAPWQEAAETYQEWLAGWFDTDAAAMAGYYRQIGADGFGVKPAPLRL